MATSANLHSKSASPQLGALLRHWRDVRGRSQIDLSLDSGISRNTSARLRAVAVSRVGRF